MKTQVVFAREWKFVREGDATPIAFRTTWSAGWFLGHLNDRGQDVGVASLEGVVTPYSASHQSLAARRRARLGFSSTWPPPRRSVRKPGYYWWLSAKWRAGKVGVGRNE